MMFLLRALPCSLMLLTLAAPLGAAAQSSAWAAYTGCTFDDGLAVAELSHLPTTVQGRTVLTIQGPRPVAMTGGEHISYAYPGTDFFATVKVEQLPAASFEQGKKDLIANFDFILAGGDDSQRNMAYALRPRLNGFEIYGLDRKRLEGNTLGIYLLFDNRTHVVASVYFLNQDPAKRKFSTQAQYIILRDHFLNDYTSCIHAPRAIASPTPKRKPSH